jgi:hypothetical protein
VNDEMPTARSMSLDFMPRPDICSSVLVRMRLNSHQLKLVG